MKSVLEGKSSPQIVLGRQNRQKTTLSLRRQYGMNQR